ncbi:hypothetical protein BB558_006260 [Smittium angustum]|uniref:N-acyl-aliphatic-L-amino acid amidohydrolase n=1 Tax=Smittium angustum TaxID=133377 RepID=A0A2U1IYG5_SMIAN|nr:hypothetical protein BB558_007312 [Smittium angustum]PVZ97772.1 hypothetical protein BB558_006260 [Smittium angustum]
MTIDEPASVTRFRDYLKIRTENPNPAYYECTEFLIKQANEIGLEHQVIEPVKGKPIVILRLPGSDPSLKSIMLGSHTDVVPVFEEFWDYPPFAAVRVPTEDGDFKIYARGSQDMKVTGSMHLEAIRNIKNLGKKLARDVYIVFSPDEEIGGADGVQKLVETEEFRKMNVGFDLDEGSPGSDNRYMFYYAERTISQVVFTAHGNTGHGSQFIEGTAIEKLLPIVKTLMNLREENLQKVLKMKEGNSVFNLGQVTTVNLNMFSGGKQVNVVPATYQATFDIRVTPNVDFEEFQNMLRNLAKEHDVDIEFVLPGQKRTITPLDRNNKLIDAFFKSLEQIGIEPVPIITPGATDARHIRPKGVPVFGFCPMINHPRMAHQHNEHVIESQYLSGIKVFTQLVQDLANTQD